MTTFGTCAICGLKVTGDHIVQKIGEEETRIVHEWCLSLEALGLTEKGDS